MFKHAAIPLTLPASETRRRWWRPASLPADVLVPAAVLLLVLASLAAPLVQDIPDPVGGSVLEAGLPVFSDSHLLGTDLNGNDVWSRIVHGGRTSLFIALSVNLLGLCIGSALGTLSAYRGGWFDTLVMRGLDALISFPPLILVISIGYALGPGIANTIFALSFFSVPSFARLARASTLRVREQPFILAAQLSGSSTWTILARHIAPNILPQLGTYALLGMGAIMTIEGAVSFLGLGVPLPQPSWGNMIYQGQLTLVAAPLLVLLPSAFLFASILSFNLLGEALRVRWASR